MVVNAQHIKGIPGRKTDVKNAEWIADLVRHGLVKASYIPNREQRELREMARYRQELIQERAQKLNRIQVVLEGCNIKLGSVITYISGKSGMSILKAIISVETDPVILSNLAVGNARNKLDELCRALHGRVQNHPRLMLNHQIAHIESVSDVISGLDDDTKNVLKRREIQALDAIPGIGIQSAERILAETDIDMKPFQNESKFSSWAGLTPECKESASEKLNTRIRKGNKYLKATLVECAHSAIRNKHSHLYTRYQRIATCRGGKRTLIAIAHTMLIAIYHILKEKKTYRDLGSEHYNDLNRDKLIKRNIQSLERLGVNVAIQPS